MSPCYSSPSAGVGPWLPKNRHPRLHNWALSTSSPGPNFSNRNSTPPRAPPPSLLSRPLNLLVVPAPLPPLGPLGDSAKGKPCLLGRQWGRRMWSGGSGEGGETRFVPFFGRCSHSSLGPRLPRGARRRARSEAGGHPGRSGPPASSAQSWVRQPAAKMQGRCEPPQWKRQSLGVGRGTRSY